MGKIFSGKTARRSGLMTLFLAALLGGAPELAAVEVPDIDYVIVRGSPLGKGPSGRADGAILLGDAEEIRLHTELFLDNPRAQHACGYNYEVEFWSGAGLHDRVPYNLECGEEFSRHSGEIEALMLEYDRKFSVGAVGTIRQLKVPVALEPEELIRKMRRDGLRVFPSGGLSSRYPYIVLQFSFEGEDFDGFEADAKARALDFMRNWPEELAQPQEYEPPFFREGIYSGGRASIKLETLVRFEPGANLKEIAAGVKSDHVKAVESRKPQYYRLELIARDEGERELAKSSETTRSSPCIEGRRRDSSSPLFVLTKRALGPVFRQRLREVIPNRRCRGNRARNRTSVLILPETALKTNPEARP